jgi:Flp pilus assembly secretin CpaC
MSAFLACRGARACIFFVATAVVAVPNPASATEPVPAASHAVREPVVVHLDQARILKLPERTATLVVGNPLIADAVVQPGGFVVITAKSYGATNLIALDRTGATLMENPVQVVGPNDHVVVVVYRGIERESYSCAPNCGRRMTVGDSPTYFTANLTQIGTTNAVAQAQMKQ